MNKLTLLIGIPGSGKTTYANKNKKENEIILSSDTIRQELFGNESSQQDNELVFNTLYSKAREYLQKGTDVIIDATNINSYYRHQTLKHFKDLNIQKVAIVFDTPIKTCIQRDKKRNRTVGLAVIEKMISRYQVPTEQEGFDKIFIFANNELKPLNNNEKVY